MSNAKPYDVTVTDVNSKSAVVYWKSTETSSTLDHFKVLFEAFEILSAFNINFMSHTSLLAMAFADTYQQMVKD